MKEFLEFYKLDYSLQIFMPETNLQSKASENKDALLGKLGMKGQDGNKPLLMILLESFMNRDKTSAPSAAASTFTAPTKQDFDLKTNINELNLKDKPAQ